MIGRRLLFAVCTLLLLVGVLVDVVLYLANYADAFRERLGDVCGGIFLVYLVMGLVTEPAGPADDDDNYEDEDEEEPAACQCDDEDPMPAEPAEAAAPPDEGRKVTWTSLRDWPRLGFAGTVTPEMRDQAARLCRMMAESNNIDFGPACAELGVCVMDNDGAAQLARSALWSTPSRQDWLLAEAKLLAGWEP